MGTHRSTFACRGTREGSRVDNPNPAASLRSSLTLTIRHPSALTAMPSEPRPLAPRIIAPIPMRNEDSGFRFH